MAENTNNFMIQFRFPLGRYVRLSPLFIGYWGHNFTNYVKFITRDGKEWTIGLAHDSKGDMWLTDNWDNFKTKYEISDGDSMYFMYKGDKRFQVVIFRINGVEKLEILPHNHISGLYFVKTMMTSSFASKLVFPEEFISVFGNDLPNPMIMVSSDKIPFQIKWTMNESPHNITLTEGWERFVEINEIRSNDLLIILFEFPKYLRVDLVRYGSERLDQFHIGKSPDPWDINIRVRNVWTTALSCSSAAKGQPLYVHVAFVNTDLRHKPKKLKVRLESGMLEEWELMYNNGRQECKIGRGWYEFRKSNNLKAGDVLKFTRQGMQDFFDLEITKC